MFNNPRDAFAIAQLRLGYSLNTTDEDEIEQATEELIEQKPIVQSYVMDEIFDKMEGGEAALAPYYAGDALVMMDNNPSLEFVVPNEGTNLFVDAMCIPKGAEQKEAAEAYINFMCEIEVAVATAEYIGYSTPHAEAFKLLDEEITSNPVAYPSQELLDKTEVFQNLPEETNDFMASEWTRVIAVNDEFNQWLMPAVLVAALGLSIFINVRRSVRSNRELREMQEDQRDRKNR